PLADAAPRRGRSARRAGGVPALEPGHLLELRGGLRDALQRRARLDGVWGSGAEALQVRRPGAHRRSAVARSAAAPSYQPGGGLEARTRAALRARAASRGLDASGPQARETGRRR